MSGLRARGGVIVRIEWKESKVRVVLSSDREQEILVRISGKEAAKVKLDAKNEVEIVS